MIRTIRITCKHCIEDYLLKLIKTEPSSYEGKCLNTYHCASCKKESTHLEDINSMEVLFRVVGEDRKVHLSDLTTNKTKCGVNTLKNYVSDKDSLYSCYECMY